MRAFFQKRGLLLALLIVGAVAIGLTLSVSHRTPADVLPAGEIALGPAPSSEPEDAASSAETSIPSPESERWITTDERTSVTTLLPKGITTIDGEGGRGVHRAVLKNGVWFPVFSPGDALRPDGTADLSPVAAVPLSITSGTPPPGQVGRPFAFGFEAIGGVPPYHWSGQLDRPQRHTKPPSQVRRAFCVRVRQAALLRQSAHLDENPNPDRRY